MECLGSLGKRVIWCFSVIILAGLFLANLIWTSHNAYTLYETVAIVRSFFNVPLLIGTFIFVIWTAKRLLKNEKSTYLLVGATIIYVAAACYIIFNSDAFIRADSKTCWEAASSFLQGDFAELQYDGYFTRSPYQLGLVLYDILLQLIWDNSKILYLFNIAEVLLIDWCSCQIANKLFANSVITRLTYLLELLFLPQFFMIMFGYGTIPGFACIMVAFYFFVCIYTADKPSAKWLVLMVLFATFATVIKKNYSIALIAMAIMLFIKLLQQKESRLYLLLAMCLVLILPMKAPDLVQAGFEAVSGITMEEPEPMIAYIAMGTDLDNTERGPGWYDGSTLWDYVDNDYNADKQLKYEKEKLANNIQASLNEPIRAIVFYCHKVISEWCDPLFQSVWSGPIIDDKGNMHVTKPLLVSLYTGGYAEKVVSCFSKCALIIVLGASLGRIINARKKIDGELVFTLYLVGGFIFHIFSEGKSQYTYMYVLVLMPMAAAEIYYWANSSMVDKAQIIACNLIDKRSFQNKDNQSLELNNENSQCRLKKTIYMAQLVVAFVLLLFALYKTYIPIQIEIESPMDSFSLPIGSYTATINYQCGSDSKVKLYADNTAAIHANEIPLSHLNNQVKYDFYVTKNIEATSLVITDCLAGDLTISSLVVTTSGAACRIFLLAWISLSIVVDFLFFAKVNKRKKVIISVLFAISLVAVIPLFFQGIHIGHDLNFHLQRIEGVAHGLSLGYFPIRMSTVLNQGYGYPVDIFYGDLLLYLPAVLRLIGFSVLSAYKLYIWFVTVLTIIFAYKCGKSILNNDYLAVLMALSYATASYRGADIYNRAAVGEYSAIAFFPLVMLALWNICTTDIKKREYKKNATILAVAMSLIIYTHVLSTEMTCFIVAFVALIFIKKTVRKETIQVLSKAVVQTFILCLAYLVPFLDYYINSDIKLKHVENSKTLIQSFGGYVGQYFAFFRNIYETYDKAGRMQITPGFCLMIALIVAILLIIMRQGDKQIYFFSGMSVFLLWLSSDIFPWDAIASSSRIGAAFAAVQFPWRYLAFATLFLSVLLGLVVKKIMAILSGNVRLQVIPLTLATFFALITAAAFDISYLSSVDADPIVDTAELKSCSADISQDEYGLYGTDYDKLEQTIGVNAGTATLVSQSGLDMVVAVETPEATGIEIPRTCYPNYRATTAEGRKLNITTGYNNRVRIELPEAYSGTITVTYREPWYWRVSEFISFMMVVILIVLKHSQNDDNKNRVDVL